MQHKISGAIIMIKDVAYGPFPTAEAAAEWMDEHGRYCGQPQKIELMLKPPEVTLIGSFVFADETVGKDAA